LLKTSQTVQSLSILSCNAYGNDQALPFIASPSYYLGFHIFLEGTPAQISLKRYQDEDQPRIIHTRMFLMKATHIGRLGKMK
jgi:hypothetical protein